MRVLTGGSFWPPLANRRREREKEKPQTKTRGSVDIHSFI